VQRQCESSDKAATGLTGLESESGHEDLSYCSVFLFAGLVLILLLQLWRGH
jgi:hypothetical protein